MFRKPRIWGYYGISVSTCEHTLSGRISARRRSTRSDRPSGCSESYSLINCIQSSTMSDETGEPLRPRDLRAPARRLMPRVVSAPGMRGRACEGDSGPARGHSVQAWASVGDRGSAGGGSLKLFEIRSAARLRRSMLRSRSASGTRSWGACGEWVPHAGPSSDSQLRATACETHEHSHPPLRRGVSGGPRHRSAHAITLAARRG